MSGRGKGGKGIGKGAVKRATPKRTRKSSSTRTITRPALKRLAVKGGVTRMSKDAYEPLHRLVLDVLDDTIRVASQFMSHAKRNTLTKEDVMQAVRMKDSKPQPVFLV